jgi:hypothetical protein
VLQLRVFGTPELIADVASQLEGIHGARHVIVSGNGAAGQALVTADLVDDAVDQAVETVKREGLAPEDVDLLRLESIGPAVAQRPLSSVVWADLLSLAGANARPLARYLVFMASAGVIAAFGVIYANTTLVVGAMAISPDLLPICAAATALVLRRWNLALRAFATTGVTARRITGPDVRAFSDSSIVRPISATVNTMLHAAFSAVPIAASPMARGLAGQRVPHSLNAPAVGNVGDRARINPVNTAALNA